MKYFTKEWLDNSCGCACLFEMKPIADKVYTNAEIDALYNKKLKSEKGFGVRYISLLRFAHLYFPKWVTDCVDIRLIATGYLPQSVYDKLNAEEKEKRAKSERIVRIAEKSLNEERKKIPQDIVERFGFHDGGILSFEEIDGDIVMIIDRNCPAFGNQTRYVKVTFEDGKIVERDDNLKFNSRIVFVNGQECTEASCIWLYDELYKTDTSIEAHMLLAEGDWGYLTITSSNIKIENIAERQIQCVNTDRAICEKIQTSCGLQQIIDGELHDAGVADAKAVGSNLALTLDLNEGQVKDGIFYRKVMRIVFENVSDCSVENKESTLLGLYVSMHREEIVKGKIRFAFALYGDATLVPFSLCCDDVTVECSLVDDK